MFLNGGASEAASPEKTLIGLGLRKDLTKSEVAIIYVELQVVLHPEPITLQLVT